MKKLINILILNLAFIFCLIFQASPTVADELNEYDVRSAVETWIRYVTADARPDAVIMEMEPYIIEGNTAAYVAHLAGGGFCLCGADDHVLPVYLYNPRDTYNPEIPDYQFILQEIAIRTENLIEGKIENIGQYQDALNERKLLWQDLISGQTPEVVETTEQVTGAPDSMSVKLTSIWHQGSPYNDQCPILTPGSDEHAAVGCVATALAQILNYWEWPNSGTSSNHTTYYRRWRTNWDEEPLTTNPNIPGSWSSRLTWTASSGGRLRMNGYWDTSVYNSAKRISSNTNFQTALDALYNRTSLDSTLFSVNFGAASYNWDILQDDHQDPVDAGDIEAAKISYHAGVATFMYYGLHESSSWGPHVPTALENYFRYDADAIIEDVDENKIVNDIQWLRPVNFFGKNSAGGGHAWVVIGYNKKTSPWQFKMNMGWGGTASWYTRDNTPGGLTLNHGHVTLIAPLNVVKFVGNTSSGDGSPDNPYRNIEDAVAASANGTTLIFKAGSVNSFTANNLVINRPFTLKGRNAIIKK